MIVIVDHLNIISSGIKQTDINDRKERNKLIGSQQRMRLLPISYMNHKSLRTTKRIVFAYGAFGIHDQEID